jgi:hypothetical protein
VSPLIVHDVAGAVAVQVSPEPDTVAVYEVGSSAPLALGGSQATSAAPSRGVAATFSGGPGTGSGVTLALADAAPLPAALVALTDTE